MGNSLDSDRTPRRRFPVAGLFRRSVAVFLVAVVLFIIGLPFADRLEDPRLVEGPLLAVVLVFGVLAVGGTRRSLVIAASLAVPALLALWLQHYFRDPGLQAIALVLAILLFVQVSVHLLHFILRAPHVDSEVLSAGIATYLLLGLTWALLYILVGIVVPDAFVQAQAPSGRGALSGFNALYFSFVTLTTMGYGDITPVSSVARMLTVLEAVTGVLYLSVLIARLVTLYTDQKT